MRKIFLFFAAILCAIGVQAEKVYLKPVNNNSSNGWLDANAIFYAWSWGGSADAGGLMEYVGLGVYAYEVGNNTTCLFTRNNPSSTGLWNNEWNRIENLTIPADNRCYKVVGWAESGTDWIAVPTAHIAGVEALTGYDWKPEQNEMQKQPNGTWTLTKTIESIANGDYEYKVTDGSWDWSLGKTSNDNATLNIPTTGKYNVTFTYDPSENTVSAVATPIYNVTVNAGEGGNVTGAGEYEQGKTATLTATANDHYVFVNWTKGEDVVAETAEYTFTVEADVELVANFRHAATTINCVPEGDLAWYLGQAHAGDTLLLADGTYDEAYSIAFDKEGLVVMAAEGAKPVIALTGEWTALNVSASTTFDGITFDGTNVAQYIIATLDSTAMTTDLTIENCEFKNWLQWAISNQYEKNVSAKSVVIDNCLFHDGTNSAVYFSENAPEGKHACQDLKVTNSTFYNIGNASSYATVYSLSNANAVDVKIDVTVDFCTFYNCQAKNTDHGAVRVSCAATISNTIIVAPESQGTYRAIYAADYSNAQAINCLTFNYEKDNGGIRSAASKTDCYLNVDPLFVDAANGDFNLQPGSPAIGKATDGSNLGDPRWKVAATEFALTMNAPAENVEATDLYIITWNVLDPNGDATIKLEYKTEEGDWTTIAEDIPSNIYAYNWNIRKMPAQTVSIRGTLANATESVESIATGTLTIIPDTVAPCTVHELTGNVSATTLTLAWINPNQEYTKTTTIETFEENTFEEYTSGAATSTITISDDKTEATIAYTAPAWEDAGIKIPVNLNNVSSFSCEMKGSASNMRVTIEQNGYDWWYKNTAVSDENWTNYTFNSFKSLSWHWTENKEIPATFDGTNVTAIYFPFSAGEGGEGTFAIRNLSIITSAPAVADYAKTIICASLTDYPTSIVAEEVVYEGTASTCDLTIDPTKDYYVSVFAQDDLGNTSVAAQYLYTAPVTHTVTATAENGTVTGAGEYEAGAEVTLTATPDFDYEFVKWSNESTENPLTITVEDNIELQAIFEEVAATTVAESGVFSISAHKTATFATGNLQYNVGTDTWRFAKQQYQVVGEQNINLGDPAFTGWIDMLGWSTDNEGNNYGVNPSNVNELYDGEFVDWGTKMGEGWSTLSAEEWSYLLNTRENAASLKQIAKVDTILGILLFPDGWVMPEDVVVEAEMDEYFEVNIYNYTLEQWTKLEQAGAIFLPAAGRRAGGYGNMINYDQVEETNPENLNGGFYRHQDNTNIYCYYWTSTINAESKVSYLHNVLALGNDEYTIGNGAIWSEKGRYGQSVRLAKVAYDKHTVTATAENGTVTGAGEYTHGAEVTLTATPDFDYEFVKWSDESTDNPRTFTAEADVELTAIFAEVTGTAVAESGVFSISAHKTATFATGNLQYNVGTETWRFAKQQYQVVGEQNINLGDPEFEGWIDMFGWSTDNEGNNYGINPSNVNELYNGNFVDWGTKMGEEWSTLSAEEWSYLLNTRENAANLKQIAKVGTTVGLLLFPDAWTMPEGIEVEAEVDAYFNVETYNYTIAQWTEMEQAGAIFLPAAGRRTGGYGNMINYDQVEETDENDLNGGFYRHQDNTNIYCYYWTSTINEETKNVSYLNNIVHLGNEEYTIGTGDIWTEKGRYGQSVRLAKVVWDTHTVTATAENGTVEGTGEYAHGAEVTLTATADEGYEFVKWTVGGEEVSTEATYTFTIEADLEVVANFEVIPVTYTVKWYTAVGETTEDTLEEGAAITKPATDPEMEGYVFMGWTNECFVAEDGSDFTAIEDFGTADADKEYYAVFAVETTTGGGGDETGSVTMQYSGSTSNMNEGNNAETVGLDANEWSVVPTKGSASNMPGLNKDGDIRLYGHADGGNYLTISSKSYTITNVTITYTSESYNNGKFYVNDNETDASNINANEFVIKNANSGTTQVRIKSLVINYTSTSGEPTTTYSDYMTTCTPEEYTIVDWSVNGEVAESTIVVEGDALVLPEAPAAPDACSEKVFMGWATTATVNADGSAITWVDETTVPEGDATYYAVFATEVVDETNETYTKTATVNIADYATANSWANEIKYENVIIDQNITATATSTGTNTGKYYVNGNNWRIYQSESATLTINAAEGVTINNVTVTYASSNSGVLTFNSNNIQSGTTVEVNASSVTFGVGQSTSNDKDNGQARVTAIEVNYTFSGTVTTTTYTDYATICVVPEYTITFDYSKDAGYITVNDVRISEKEVTYEKGTELTVKALTFNNYRFDAWTDEEGNELTTEPEYTFTVTGDVVLQAIFTYEEGAVGTGVENNNVVTNETVKMMKEGRLIIIRNGKTYNAQGQMIE